MKKLLTLVLLVFVFISCKENSIPVDNTGDQNASSLQKSEPGIDALGPVEIPLAQGSGVVIGGTGLNTGSGVVNINVPAEAIVKQVLLYWVGASSDPASNTNNGDSQLFVNGTSVDGTQIGGPHWFYTDTQNNNFLNFTSFRADITALAAVAAGGNAVSISGSEYTGENNGAGIVVIYEIDGQQAEIVAKDGQDLAYYLFDQPPYRKVTVPQVFNFASANEDRQAKFTVFSGSVEPNRPNRVRININGTDTFYDNLLGSTSGADFDAVEIAVTIPAGISELTAELISWDDPTNIKPASLVWISSVLAIELPAPPPPPDDGCTYTIGYWKTHSKAFCWGKKYDKTWDLIGPKGEKTIFYLSGMSHIAVLWTPVKGNPYYILAHQFIAAKLNMLNGASSPDVVYDAFQEAKLLFETYTPKQVAKGSKTLKAKFVKLGEILAKYNEGKIGPGHCDCYQNKDKKKKC